MTKLIKAQILVTHNRKTGLCQISIKSIANKFFVILSDYAERKKVIFKKCDTLLEAGVEYKSFVSRLEKKQWKTLPVSGTCLEFSADTFDFSKALT